MSGLGLFYKPNCSAVISTPAMQILFSCVCIRQPKAGVSTSVPCRCQIRAIRSSPRCNVLGVPTNSHWVFVSFGFLSRCHCTLWTSPVWLQRPLHVSLFANICGILWFYQKMSFRSLMEMIEECWFQYWFLEKGTRNTCVIMSYSSFMAIMWMQTL